MKQLSTELSHVRVCAALLKVCALPSAVHSVTPKEHKEQSREPRVLFQHSGFFQGTVGDVEGRLFHDVVVA